MLAVSSPKLMPFKNKCLTGYFLKIIILTKERKKVKSRSRVQLFVTPWTVAHQVPPSMEFFRQEYQSRLPFPSAGDLPNPGIEPRSLALQADTLPSEPPGNPKKVVPIFSMYFLPNGQQIHPSPQVRIWGDFSIEEIFLGGIPCNVL